MTNKMLKFYVLKLNNNRYIDSVQAHMYTENDYEWEFVPVIGIPDEINEDVMIEFFTGRKIYKISECGCDPCLTYIGKREPTLKELTKVSHLNQQRKIKKQYLLENLMEDDTLKSYDECLQEILNKNIKDYEAYMSAIEDLNESFMELKIHLR